VLPQLPNLSPAQRRLLKLFASLEEADQESLLAFAEFLATRTEDEGEEQAELVEPRLIPRPAEESVVAAIKRLSDTYFMLDRSLLLDETSSLMTAHLMSGRSAVEVVDELEQLFQQKYQEYLGLKNP
jgi:hypothetical protein